MKLLPNVRVLAWSAFCLAGVWSAVAQQRDAFPSVEAIPVQPGSRLEKDFRAQERTWARTALLKTAGEAWKGREWEAEAVALMEAALEQIEKEHAVLHPLVPLAGRFHELLKKAPDDPVLAVFAAQAIFGEREERRECMPLIEKALSSGRLPSVLEAMAHRLHWQVAEMEVFNGKEQLQKEISGRWLEALTRSLTDGSYDKESLDVLVRHHVQALRTLEPATTGQLENYVRQVETAGLDDWARLTLLGTVDVEVAWMKRSAGWTQDVTEAQWKGFAEQLNVARDHLGQAARLRPDRPEAATLMITVAMGEGLDLSELRAWFNRAATAQFDYLPAYKAFLWACRPRWGGDLQLMLAFGKACAETKRHDTQVPLVLMTAAADVTEEIGDPRPAFRHPQIRASMVEMCRGSLEAAGSVLPLRRHLLQSHAAMAAWLADEDALAQQALDQAGPRLHQETRTLLVKVLMHEAMMRAEIAADTGAYGEAIRIAANPAPKARLEEVHAAFMKVDEKGLSPDALAYLHEARHMTGLTNAVEAGGWVDLPFHKHLTAFYQSERGEWQVDAEGSLVCRGTEHPRSRLVLRVPVGQDIELKGEIAFGVPAEYAHRDGSLGIGPMLCWSPGAPSGLKAMLFWLNPRSACTKAFATSMQASTPDITFDLQEWNTFSVRKAGGKLTYEINGRAMASSWDLEKLEIEADDGLIGFNAYRMPSDCVARIRKVSIRKITAADLATAQPAASAVDMRPDDSMALPVWWWKAALALVVVIAGVFLPRFISSEE
jgi:hypothetical protein